MYLKKVIVNIPNIRKSCKKEITFMKSYFSFVFFDDFLFYKKLKYFVG